MWIFAKFGFFSVVQKPGTDYLTVRTRVRQDLDNLRDRYLPQLSEVQGHAGTDYQWRATVSHQDFADAIGRITSDIHYPNFKSEVARNEGQSRAHCYGKVWEILYQLSESE